MMQFFCRKLRFLFAAVSLTVLGGCFESPEQVAARQAQHNGKNVNELIQGYGTPVQRTAQAAVWVYNYSYYTAGPTIGYINNNIFIAGQTQTLRQVSCRFTAFLNGQTVVRTEYQGNGCHHFAPKLR